MPVISPDLRDRIITEFRSRVCEKLGTPPFEHQARWWAATDGRVLLETPPIDPLQPSVTVRLPSGDLALRGLGTRAEGRARVVAELGGFKAGKSWGAAMWATGFAAIPNARVVLVGIEYDMCTPEFDYILEAICSSRGLNERPASLQNRPKDGRLWLQLRNGARFEARSWERRDALKGKEIDCYVICEGYQLPGIECYTGIVQNLEARRGYFVLTTTPDRPWVVELHERGHSHPEFPEWACFCGVPRAANPYTFDQRSLERDRTLLTREKFVIGYLGQIGMYIGSVFEYQRSQRLIAPSVAPELHILPDRESTPANIRVPHHFRVECGADTGTYLAAVVVAFDETGRAFVLDELTNYTYIAGTAELDPQMSLTNFAQTLRQKSALWGSRPIAWCDANTQFRTEFGYQQVFLVGNTLGREARTEAARQYFQHDKILLAPWLKILPYELEHARWPDHHTSSGKYERLKQNDHLVDALEHVLSRHLSGTQPAPIEAASPFPWRKRRPALNPHLGRE